VVIATIQPKRLGVSQGFALMGMYTP